MEIGYAALSTSVSVDKIIFVVIVCNLLVNGVTSYITCNFYRYPFFHIKEALPGWGGGSHVARLNFKTSRVGVYKCLSLIVGFAVTVAIWPREVVSCRDFILRAVTTFWAVSLVGIYPGRVPLRVLMNRYI